MSSSDQEKSFYPTNFDVIEETVGELDIEEIDFSDCEILYDEAIANMFVIITKFDGNTLN